METIVLEAEPRTAEGSPVARRMRAGGYIPGNVYGPGIEGSILVKFIRIVAEPAITRAANETKLAGKNPREEMEFAIKLSGKEYKARLGEVQRDVISRKFTHLDFIVKED